MAERKVPRIRFKGFEEDWEQRKLGEISQSFSGGTPCVGIREYYGGEIPFIRSAEINSEETELFLTEKGLNESSAKIVNIGDILYALYGATSGEVSRAKIKGAINQAVLAIIPNKEFDAEYLVTWLYRNKQSIIDTFLQGGQGNLSGNIVKNLTVSLPLSKEQYTIGRLFWIIDSLLSLHQRKLEKLKILKKAMLEKMFPKNGAKVPEIRFSGFTEDWEQRKFNELYKRNDERNNGQFGQDKTISISTMTFNELGNGAADSSIDFYKVLRIGDIAFEGHTNKEFRYGRFGLNDIGSGIMSPRFTTLRPITKQEFTFWKYYIHDEKVMRQKLVCSTKAGTMMNELVIDDLMRQSILVPSLSEQKKTGDYFKGLDHLLSLHQRKLEKLRQIKKSMLERMFV